MRLIDADELFRELENIEDVFHRMGIREFDSYNEGRIDGIINAENVVKSAPTIEAEPIRHGHWVDAEIQTFNISEPIEVCSECDTFFLLKHTGGGYKYCPECGAKMDEEEE